jgi:hypothetical protein
MEVHMATDKKFNPNFGTAFSDDRFGDGAVTITLTAEGLKALTDNIQVGAKLVFKKNKVTKYGNMCYFTEILPPFEGNIPTPTTSKGNGRKAPASDLD